MSSLTGSLPGVQQPRILLEPPSVSSAADEAIALAAEAGLDLDPWQQFALHVGLGMDPLGFWSAFEVGIIVPRQNGKGSILEARELFGLFLAGEELIIHSAHEFKTAKEAFYRMRRIIENAPALDAKVRQIKQSNEEVSVELLSGARLRYLARKGGTGRGFTGDCVVLDEAFQLDGETLAAILPTLSARANPQVWYTSSAPKSDSLILHRLRERGIDPGPDDARLAFLEWSMDPANPDFDEGMLAANPAWGIRVNPAVVSAERAAMTQPEFLRERYGIPDDIVPLGGEQVIDDATWAKLTDADAKLTGTPVFAVDISSDRSKSAIAVAGESGGKHLVEIVAHAPGTAWVVARVQELLAQWGGTVMIDSRGAVGALLAEFSAAKVNPTPIAAVELGRACGQFFDAAVTGQLVHLGQPALTEAVRQGRKKPLGDAWAWSRKDSLADITPLMAATMALFGFKTRGTGFFVY